MVIHGKRFDSLHWLLGILTALLMAAGSVIGSQANARIVALETKAAAQEVRLATLETDLATIKAIAQRTEANTKQLIQMHLK